MSEQPSLDHTSSFLDFGPKDRTLVHLCVFVSELSQLGHLIFPVGTGKMVELLYVVAYAWVSGRYCLTF